MRLLCIVLLSLLPVTALADVVGPIDEGVTCPPGSQRTLNHCGTICVPMPCERHSDCRATYRCEEVSLCINSERYCGRGDTFYDRVYGDCSGPCATGSCQSIRTCTNGPPSVDSGSGDGDSGSTTPADGGTTVVTYGCGCRATRSSTLRPWFMGLAVLFAIRRSRR